MLLMTATLRANKIRKNAHDNNKKAGDNMTVAQQVGENLRAARKAKGMTQQKVAEAMNKYQSDYSDYERGLIQLDYDKIIFLCNLFEITPNQLFYLG